jgi:hypothetical protein
MKNKIAKNLSLLLLLLAAFQVNAQTAGTLTFKFTSPLHASGNYRGDGKYLVAVWIESCSPCTTSGGTSTFVKTKLKYGSSGNYDHLATWTGKSGQNVVDATSGSTTASIFTQNIINWNGTNVAGTAVADGSYRVAIQETWGHGSATATRYFPFTKGAAADNQSPTTDTNFTAISLVWMPTALAVENFSENPQVTIYPNPTNGVFNIDMKNEVKNIKVINILGKIIYNENISASAIGTTKSIDLTDFANGIYFVNISNAFGTSNYKLILNK